VRDRLRLHYGADHSFTMREVERNQVQVTVTFPLQMSERPAEQMASFGD
jgi:hypothetical protein